MVYCSLQSTDTFHRRDSTRLIVYILWKFCRLFFQALSNTVRTRGQSEVWSSKSGGGGAGGGGGGGGGGGRRERGGGKGSRAGIGKGMTKPSHREQVTNTGGWMVQAGVDSEGIHGGIERNMIISSFASPETLESVAQMVSQELLDDAILNVVFEVHQSVKTGLMMLELGSIEEEQKFLQVNAEGLDVFGQAPIKKQHECVCPNCSRNLAASRFAPHLEKCMGMGRNSSRIASRRIQNSTKENINNNGGGSDDDDDDDWMVDRKRKKRDKNSPRRTKNAKVKSESVSSSSSTTSSSSVETTFSTGTTEEKRAMLKQICGVVSEHTRKMCTRSVRCPQHTTEQRRAVRDQVLNGSNSETTTRAADSTSRGLGDVEDIHVDIDGLDEGQLASSWENDHSDTTSPADSTSTNNSTSSLAKRSGKNKKKSSKSSKSSNSSHGSLLD